MEMPEHWVISTFCEQPPSVSQTWAAIFLLFFIFQIREHCYNCSNYCGNTSYQSNNTFTSLPKLNSSNCRQSLGANRQFRHFQNQYSIVQYSFFIIFSIGYYSVVIELFYSERIAIDLTRKLVGGILKKRNARFCRSSPHQCYKAATVSRKGGFTF